MIGGAILLSAIFGLALPADETAPPECPPEIAAQAELCAALGVAELAPGLRYELYRLADAEVEGSIFDAAPYYQTGVALYLGETSDPFWFGASLPGESWFDAPILVETQDHGALVVIRRKFVGTAALIVDHVFVADQGQLRALEPTYDPETDRGVVRDLADLLPNGLAIWRGVAIDYETLSGRSALWRPEDANCCPSGGTLEFSLQFNDDRTAFAVRDFRIVADAPAAD
jgi:hypothetical protein